MYLFNHLSEFPLPLLEVSLVCSQICYEVMQDFCVTCFGLILNAVVILFDCHQKVFVSSFLKARESVSGAFPDHPSSTLLIVIFLCQEVIMLAYFSKFVWPLTFFIQNGSLTCLRKTKHAASMQCLLGAWFMNCFILLQHTELLTNIHQVFSL